MPRIAKFLSMAGIASRRGAERLITEGRISVNGEVISNVGLSVSGDEKICYDEQVVIYKESPPRLWEYHKPAGCIVSEKDEKGRVTIFDKIASLSIADLPRLIAVGRLDYNSEGLLLLTDNGGLARELELPANNIMRHYRVRVLGTPPSQALAKLRQGMTIEGVQYRPAQVEFSDNNRKGSANSWLEVGLHEGKNREIRKLFEALGFSVNRLIRHAYGEFALQGLTAGQLREVPKGRLKQNLASMKVAFAQ